MAVTETTRPTSKPRLVDPTAGYAKAKLIAPTTFGYLYVAAAVQPAAGIPIVWPSGRRRRLLDELKQLAHGLEQLDAVRKVTLFRAIAMPPTARFSAYLKERGASIHVADFDVILLVETISPQMARQVQTDPAFGAIIDAMRGPARTVFSIAARNIRHIGDVDTSRGGLFLFNHFAAADPAILPELWDHLAGWYVAETGLDNSVALTPLEGDQSDYAIINWARWDAGPVGHFWSMLSKPSFWRYVTRNLDANRAASMPIYCRMV